MRILHQPAIIAHRGASGTAPENTLAAIKKALDIGVDMIEIDVRQSRDGVIVLMHDKTIDRTTTGKGNIRDMDYPVLKKLDAGSWFSDDYKGETIPSLEEVIKLVNGQCLLLIEVKGNSRIYPALEENILGIIHRNHARDWCILQSFFTGVLRNFRMLDKDIRLHKLILSHLSLFRAYADDPGKYENVLKTFRSHEALNPSYRWITKTLVDRIHANDQKINCWTVNKEEEMSQMISLGVDGIITNYPEKLRQIIAASGIKGKAY